MISTAKHTIILWSPFLNKPMTNVAWAIGRTFLSKASFIRLSLLSHHSITFSNSACVCAASSRREIDSASMACVKYFLMPHLPPIFKIPLFFEQAARFSHFITPNEYLQKYYVNFQKRLPKTISEILNSEGSNLVRYA